MTLRRLRLLTAGESHGPGLSGILDGLPADLRVSTAKVDRELARRQHGYGSGRRMQIERDRVEWTAGLRFGRTLGSPLAFSIPNRDWANWQERMSVEPTACVAPTQAHHPGPSRSRRPGRCHQVRHRRHPQRARARLGPLDGSARGRRRGLPPAARGLRRAHLVVRRPAGTGAGLRRRRRAGARSCPMAGWSRIAASPRRCAAPTRQAEAAMIAEVDAAIEAGDSIGGSFVVVAEGMPVGIGSNAEWDTRIDTAIAAALMGIQAVKGVEIGLGFGAVARRG